MPSTSSSSLIRQPIVYLIARPIDGGEHAAPDDGEQTPQDLVTEQGRVAAVEQAVHAAEQAVEALGRLVGADEADQDTAQDAADEVDADDVERVVEAEPVLQADRRRRSRRRRRRR